MPTIQDLRADYPDLGSLDDDQLIGAVQQALYPDLPRERVAAHFGVKPRPVAPAAAAAPAPSGPLRRAADVALSIGKGVIGVPEALIGMANLATGGRAGQMAEQAGVRFKDAKAVLDEYMSPEAQAAQQKFQQSTGVVDAIGTAVTNPSLIVNAAAESLPLMGMGGAIARPLMAAVPRLGAVGAAAAGEGIGSAGSSAEQIRQSTADGLLTDTQAGVAAVSGAATGLLGVLGGKIAQRLGIADVDTLIAGGASAATTKGFTRRVLEGAVSEGLLEELPQSIQEQVAQNFALGKPLDEGVPQAAVLGALTGGAMGGAANVFAGRPPPGPMERAASTVLPPPSPGQTMPPDGTQPPSPTQAPGDQPPVGAAGLDAAGAGREVLPGGEVAPPGGAAPVGPLAGTAAVQPDPDGVVAPPATAPTQAPLIDARAQREADRPPEPTEPVQPEDVLNSLGKPFTTMPGAMRALKGREATHEIVRVSGGLVLRPKTGAAPLDAAGPVEAGSGSAAPAPAPAAPPEAATPAPAPAELDMGQPGKPRTVTVNDQTVALTPEQAAEWDRVNADFKARFDAAQAAFDRSRKMKPRRDEDPDVGQRTPQEQLAATRKRLGMELSAERRRIAGVQTPKEQAAAAQQAARLRAGDTVETPQGTGTVVATVFGKVKVRIGDQTVMVPRDSATKTTQEVLDAPVQPARADATTQSPAAPAAEAPAPAGAAAAPAPSVPGAGTPATAEADGLTPGSVAADLEALSAQDRRYRAPPELRAAVERSGLRAADPRKDTEWSARVADGRGDVVVKIDPATAEATVVGEYMGKEVFQRKASGGPAVSAAIAEARAGLEEGERRRKAGKTSALPDTAAPALAGPPINKEWTAFAPESGTKGIPRADMPQIKAEHRGALTQFLKGWGITHEQEADVDPGTLKPTQAEFSPAKVRKAREFTGGNRAILVSSDGYVVDGHHQWAAALEDSKPIRVIRLDGPIDGLLPIVKEFPSAEAAPGATTAQSAAPTAQGPAQSAAPGPSSAAEKPEATAPAPAPKSDKAEIRPYRRADGSIGYEAVPIVAQSPAPAARPPVQPSANTLVTEDAAERARALLRKKLGQVSSGIDPEVLQAGITLAAYHVERGARTFAAYARAMVDDMGDLVKPYLQSWYMAMRSDPGYAALREGMDKASVVEDLDVDQVLADTAPRPENGPPVEPTAAVADTATKESTSDATNQPGMGAGDPQGGRGAGGGRGQRAQQPDARDDPQDLGADEPGNVDAPVGDQPAGSAGTGASGTDVGAQEGADGGRVPRDRRPRAGRARNPDAGAGGRPGASDRSAGTAAEPVDPATVSPANIGPGDFVIADPLKVVGGGQVARFEKNKAAITLRNALVEAGRAPTREEQEVLAGYTGWGSFGQELFQGNWSNPAPKAGWEARDKWLRDNLGQSEWEGLQTSIINAHYTDPPTVMAMWDMVRRMGFTGGRVLEPSIGIGNFFGLMPPELTARSQRAGIELDEVTGSMAQMLYPQANIQIKGYEKSTTPDNFYDLVIGNWPFFEQGPADRRYNRLAPTLHDYFFLKALDQTRPGGLVVGITTKGTMDKKGVGARMEMARKAELVAAFRLPTGAFEEYAGTKVVTDIIILRKRDKPAQLVDKDGWIQVLDHDTKEGTKVPVNEYFHRNPTHVIGEIDFGHGTTTMRPGLIVHRPADMMEQLRRVVDLVPEGAFRASAEAKTISYVANHTSDRTNALTATSSGLFIVQGEYLAPANEVAKYTLKDEAKTATRERQLRALIDMRRLYGELIDAERAGKADGSRLALRTAYEAFTKEHGPLSESFGLGYLEKIDDPFYPALAALEVRAEGAAKGAPQYRPAAILSRSTMRGAATLEAPTISDAFVLARNEVVNPTPARIAEIAGEPVDKVRDELISAGAAFQLPNGDFAPADLYLSGNVREKMREAVAARDAGDAAMERNIKALAEVMPADVPYYKIETQMGATWVPGRTYEEFIAHMLGMDKPEGVSVQFGGGAWKINFDSALNHRPEARSGYGSPNVYFKRLVRAAIANQTINVKRKDRDGNEYIDDEATKEVNGKIADMRLKFGEWLWKDPSRRVELEREYNEVRNAYATPKFDGSFLGFQGMALSLGRGPFSLREHQVNAIWRALVTRKSLNAHEVGTGKTFTMGGIAVESRRYGIAKKPMLFAHNANSKSVAHEIQMMYPGAKVLYIDNLGKENLKTRMMQIANDDWDVVVLPHSVIDRIGFKEETLMSMAKEEILELELAAEEAAEEDGVTITSDMWDDEKELAKLRSPTAKQLVKQRMKIMATIQKLAMQASKEDSVAFEDMGVDMILVDEAHEFKKPPIATKMRMKGLQTSTSDRSIAMMFLTRYVRSMNGGGNVHLFTGTPITNTMTEVFHMMRYIMQEEMQSGGLADWDGWFGSFAREVSDVELNPAGEYEAVTRLQSFINVPELRRMIGQYMDVVFSDDMPEMLPRAVNGKRLGDPGLTERDKAELLNGRTENALDRPYKKVINESSDMTPEQMRVFERVQGYARAWRNMAKKDRKEAMMSGAPESPIIHEGIAARASFDVRLVDAIANAGKEGLPEMAPHPDSKPARVHKNLLELYHSDPRVAQVVFMDTGMSTTVTRREGPAGMKRSVSYPAFSTMKDMVERLVQAGIPREQIATVTGATSKDKRKEIADAMNSGKVRIVFGSSDSLGVGVNMQRNLRAMHHMDAPWMPGELEQRNGRGHRQGNQWNTVLEFRYLTDRLDGRRWQVLAIKQRFITDFMKSKGDVRVIEGDAASDEGGDILSTFSEAAGDPRILMREKFKKKLEQLQSRERLHGQAQAEARGQIKSYTEYIATARRKLASLRERGVKDKISAFIESQRGDGFSAVIDGQRFDKRAEASEFLEQWAEDNLRKNDDKVIGTYGGLELRAVWPNWASRPDISVTIAGERVDGVSFASLDSQLRGRRDSIEAAIEAAIDRDEKTVAHAKTVAAEPFHLGEQLAAVQKQLNDLIEDIDRNPVAPPFWLRAGAPVDTEVFRNGKPFVVSGHRWSPDGWFVLARDAKGEVAIRYTDAQDKQGLPLYEAREFEAPTVQQGSAGSGVPVTAAAAPKARTVLIEEGGSTNLRQTGAPEANTDDVVFSRGREPADNHHARLTALAEAIQRTWANGPKVVVARNMRDTAIPERVRVEDQKQRSNGATGEPEGFFYQGTAYLLTDQLGGAKDALRVLFHEALGHYGLRGVFGKELGTILDRMAVLQAGKVRAKARQYGLDFEKQSERRHAAEEVLAEMAQTNPELGWVQKAIAAIRTWLRDNVPGFADLKMTDDEVIRSFILPARGWVTRGEAAGQRDAVPAFQRGESTNPTDTAAFRKWFGDSKVVDAEGKPRVMYHGTRGGDFSEFKRNPHDETGLLGVAFSPFQKVAERYANDENRQRPEDGEVRPKVIAAYIKSSRVPTVDEFYRELEGHYGKDILEISMEEKDAYAKSNGIAAVDTSDAGEVGEIFVIDPTQIKSATDNRGTFDPTNPDIRFSRSTTLGDIRSLDQQKIRDHVADLLGGGGAKVSWWQRTVGTQYAKAQKHPEFRRVFDAVQSYLEDVSTLANRAANEAPSILPKLDNWQDLKRSAAQGLGLNPKDAAALTGPVFEGTVGYTRSADGAIVGIDEAERAAAALSAEEKAASMVRAGRLTPEVLRMWQGLPIEQFEAAVETRYRSEMLRTGVVWTDAELRERFQLTDAQIGHYREFRAAVDRSLDQLVASDVLRLLGDVPPGFKAMAVHAPVQLRAAVEEYLQQTRPDDADLWNDIADRFNRIDDLKEQGYAPLMRFGKYKVHVTGADGETLFFGLYESAPEANRMVRELRQDPEMAGATFTQGVLSQEAYKLFSQVPPESLEMFAEALGAEKTSVFQEYIRLAKNNRSALKRLIRRKGTAGFSEDVPRVLATFVTSNARLGAAAMNLPGAKAATETIRDGDVKDEAVKLVEAVQNPTSPAAAIRGLMFMNFIGGSIASAVVNLTQPITMTLPYLSQFGGLAAATQRLMAAAKVVAAGTGEDRQLAAALARAEADGIVSPQEIHHLQAQAMATWGTNPLARRAAFIWSAPFSLAEQWNRRVSFIAAYNTARERGEANPFGFAEQAVIETQGLYNAGNAANWARNPAGALALQFKQYSVHYLEWMVRMWKSGPEGKKAVGIALLLLAAAGGADGLPFAEDIDDLVDTIGQALGYDANFKRSRREFIAKDLGMGDMAAEVFTRGLSSLPGVPMDVSLRMGMGNLIPATGLLLRSNTDRSRDVLEVAGAAGGLAKQYTDAATKALGGDVVGGAVTALPVALQNVAKAAGMWSTGEARDEKGRRVMEADAVDGFMRFMGFNPAEIARESQRMGMIRRSEQLAKNIEGGIVDRWARGVAEKDAEAVAEARAELAEWNRNNPGSPIRITVVQVRQRVRNLMRDRSERFLKSVSPERRAAASEVLK